MRTVSLWRLFGYQSACTAQTSRRWSSFPAVAVCCTGASVLYPEQLRISGSPCCVGQLKTALHLGGCVAPHSTADARAAADEQARSTALGFS